MQRDLMNAGFRDIYVHEENGNTVYCFRTGMTVYEEVFDGSMYTAAGWNTAGYTLNVLDDFPTRLSKRSFREPQAFDVEADGVSLAWDWDCAGFEQHEETAQTTGAPLTHGILTLKSRLRPLRVRVHTVLDGTPVFTRWIELENTGERAMNISGLAPMSGGIMEIPQWRGYMAAPDCNKLFSLGYMECSAWGHEGAFLWHALPDAELCVNGKYKNGCYRHPFFMLRSEPLGSMMIAQMGWSGGYRFSFLQESETDTACLSFRADLEYQKPLLVLDPGERFDSPRMHVGMLQGGLDDAVNGMHAHLRKSEFTLPEARGVYGWAEGGMGPERLMDVKATKHFADTMAAIGAETLIIDAGWYCPLGTECTQWHPRAGDWFPDPERYPEGIQEIRDYIHSKGLLFGLWLDLERLGCDSRAAKAHPEWISKCWVNGTENSQLNLAIPEACAWAESELARVITEYGIDLFRLDYNLGTDHLLNRIDRGSGPESTYLRYCRNARGMYERLRRRFPDVVFENCAGGGGRTDVGFIRQFAHTWVSDWNVPPRSLAIANGMTMALPPERVDRLFSGMNSHTRGSLDFQVRTALFARPTSNDYNAVGSEPDPDQLAFVKHSLDIYKTVVRPYIPDSRIYHHTPEMTRIAEGTGGSSEQPNGTGILERTSGDGRHGILGVFKLANSWGRDTVTVFPRGIDAALTYRLRFDNSGAEIRVTGYEMQNAGVRVRIDGAITSELLVYEAE